MPILLDTDTVSYLINRKSPNHEAIITSLQQHSPSDVFISLFTKCELLYGINRVDNCKQQYKAQLQQAVSLLLARMNILEPSPKFAQTYAMIRSTLVSRGQDIGAIDTMIAAQAIAHQYALITNNTRHYERVNKYSGLDTLKLKNWCIVSSTA